MAKLYRTRYETIPCIIKDTSKLRGELIEVEENLSGRT